MTADLPALHPARPPARCVEDRGRYATLDREGAVMDRSVAAVTALAGAIAGDAWRQVHEAIAGLWRRGHSPHRPTLSAPSWTSCGSSCCRPAATVTPAPSTPWKGAWQHRPLVRRCNPVGCRSAAPGFGGGGGVYDRHDRFVAGEGERVEALTTGGRAVRALQAR